MKLAKILALLSVTLLLVGCAWRPPSPVPKVKSGPPIYLSSAILDPRPWKSETLPEKVETWFRWYRWDETLGQWYIDWDAERQPFDAIVVHHSATGPKATAEEIEASQKRLYEARYSLDAWAPGGNDPYVKGLPIHSNHVVNGKERFIAYHHLVYEDGRITTELQPLVEIKDRWYIDMVGWHSGNWEANCRSLAICLVGNYTKTDPPEAALNALASLIAYYKTFNPNLEVKPHKAFKATECPGGTWESWSQKLH